jgi:recombination protein RecA
VILFFTNQIRTKINVAYGDPTETSGGKALKFYASVRLETKKKAKIKSGEDILGNITEIKVVKNKCAPPYRVAETEIRYGEGVPKALDVLLLALKYNVIDKSGQWLSFNDMQLGQGKDKAYNFLKESPETLSLLEKAVRERVGLSV